MKWPVGLLLMLHEFGLSHTPVPPITIKDVKWMLKKGGGDETRPTGYPLMEVVHMHRFWTFLTWKFTEAYLKKKVIEEVHLF